MIISIGVLSATVKILVLPALAREVIRQTSELLVALILLLIQCLAHTVDLFRTSIIFFVDISFIRFLAQYKRRYSFTVSENF